MAEPFYKQWLLKKEDGTTVDASEDKAWYDGIDWGGMAQRIGWESVPAAAAYTAGLKYARSLPHMGAYEKFAGPAKMAIPVAAGAMGGFFGKRADQLTGNVLPGDEGIMSDILAAGGGMMPIGIDAAGAMARRTAMGWKESTRAASDRALRESEKFGIQPTAGQITDKQLVQSFERFLREMPVSGSGVDKAHENAYQQFQNAVRHLTDDGTLDLSTDAWATGQKIKDSAGRKVEAFNNRTNALFRMVDKVVSNSREVPLTKVQDFLETYAGKFQNPTPELKEALGDDFIKKIQRALTRDTDEVVDGVAVRGPLESMTWHDLNVLRQQVGKRTAKAPSDTFDPKLARQLYEAILDDMETVVRQIDSGTLRGPVVPGSQGVSLRAWNNARRYYRQGIQAMEETYDKVLKAEPDRLFRSLEAGVTGDIAMARKASDPNTWRFVQAAVAERMGLAKPGLQDVEGQVFSPRAFLTNYNKFRRGSRGSQRGFNLMFGEAGKYRGISEDLDVLARISDRMSRVSKPLQPSGNIKTGAMLALAPGVAFAPLETAAAVGGLKGSSMLWTSPRFLRWLAKGENVKYGTRSFLNWAATMPTYAMIHNLAPSDEVVLREMKDSLQYAQGSDVPSVPDDSFLTNEPKEYNVGIHGYPGPQTSPI